MEHLQRKSQSTNVQVEDVKVDVVQSKNVVKNAKITKNEIENEDKEGHAS